MKRVIPRLLVVFVAFLLLVPTIGVPSALAQDAPNYPDWAPGAPAPDGEELTDDSAGQSGAGTQAAPAPQARAGRCRYNLRGRWQNNGTQTSPSRDTYSVSVRVVQSGTGRVRVIQTDGTVLQGTCNGRSLLLDAYYQGRYIGQQVGLIRGPTGSSTQVAPGGGGGGSRVSVFSIWDTDTGAGFETWTRSTA
jgi:hypothetical protein